MQSRVRFNKTTSYLTFSHSNLILITSTSESALFRHFLRIGRTLEHSTECHPAWFSSYSFTYIHSGYCWRQHMNWNGEFSVVRVLVFFSVSFSLSLSSSVRPSVCRSSFQAELQWVLSFTSTLFLFFVRFLSTSYSPSSENLRCCILAWVCFAFDKGSIHITSAAATLTDRLCCCWEAQQRGGWTDGRARELHTGWGGTITTTTTTAGRVDEEIVGGSKKKKNTWETTTTTTVGVWWGEPCVDEAKGGTGGEVIDSHQGRQARRGEARRNSNGFL